jgi:tetratricopeptide (TPR) repeat protein
MPWYRPCRRRAILIALSSLVLCGLSTMLGIPTSRYLVLGLLRCEPFYDGKPLSYWVYSIKNSTSDRDHGFQVLGRLGSQDREAIPVFINILEDGRRGEMEIVRSLRHAMQSAEEEEEAEARLRQSLLPVVEALSRMGPDAQAAIPVLVKYLGVSEIGNKAATALAEIGPTAVPALLSAVEDKNTMLSASHSRALLALSRMGPGAREAVPVLIRTLKSRGKFDPVDDGDLIVYALGKIGPDSKAAVPVLIDQIRASEFPHFKRLGVRALGDIGLAAEVAAPFLLDLRRDACTPQVRDIFLRKEIVRALTQIDPGAAAKAAKIRPPWSDEAINQYEKSDLFCLTPRQQIARLDEAIRLEPEFAAAYARRAGLHYAVGNHKLAVADFERALRLALPDPAAATRRVKTQNARPMQSEPDADQTRALRLSREKDAYNEFAWLLATSTDATLRDGKRAVLLASRACELTEWKLPEILDTLAAAYAEAGDFARAIRWQQKALDDPEFKKQHGQEASKRLNLYEKRKAYRDDTGSSALDATSDQAFPGRPSNCSAFYSSFDSVQGCLRATVERMAPLKNFIWDFESGGGGGGNDRNGEHRHNSCGMRIICSAETLDVYLRELQQAFEKRAQQTQVQVTDARKTLEDNHVRTCRIQYISGAAQGEVAANVTSQETDPDDPRQRIWYVSITTEEKHP